MCMDMKVEHIKMCLMMDGDTAKLVVSDFTNNELFWIEITADETMIHHKTHQLQYHPRGSYNDKGVLMLCDAENHKIPRYSHDGQLQGVISLPDDVKPCYVTGHGDGESYVISDPWGHQVVIFNKGGQVKTRYEGEIHGVELRQPYGVITYGRRVILVCDIRKHQVLMMWRDGDEVRQLLQPHSLMYLASLYLDTEHHRLYVSGRDQDDERYVLVFKYTFLTADNKTLTENITKLHLTVDMDKQWFLITM